MYSCNNCNKESVNLAGVVLENIDNENPSIVGSNGIEQNKPQDATKKLLFDVRCNFHKLDLEITHMEISLKALYQQRETMRSQIAHLEMELSSQNMLPDELLAKIFVFASPFSAHLKHGCDDMPWTLLRVCSRWRRVALSEHRLWNALVAVGSMDRTKAWLQLLWSQNSTSLVSLDLRGCHAPICIIDILSRYSPRFYDLSLEDPDNGVVELMDNNLFEFPHLESATLKLTHHLNAREPPFKVFRNAPKLHDIQLIGLYGPLFDPRLEFPWPQLTSITLTKVTLHPTTIHWILKECCSLIQFTVTLLRLGGETRTETPLSDIILPALEELRLVIDFHCHLDGFFHRLKMPLLKILLIKQASLQFQSPPPPRTFPQAEFLAMLQKSPLIETLTLRCMFSDVDLLSILRKTPRLMALYIHPKMSLPGVIFDMVRNGGLLPNLEQLRCSTASARPVLDLLEKQCSEVGPQEPPGLMRMEISCSRNEGAIMVRQRFEALKPQLHKAGKMVELREVMINGRLWNVFEGDDAQWV